MLWTLETLRGCPLRATDGTLGGIEDVYFDDRDFVVRYLVVDTGTWLPGRKVLLPPGELGRPDAGRMEFPVDLTREQVKNSPDVATDKPFSRQQEEHLYGYYGWTPYWTLPPYAAGAAGAGLAGAAMVPPPMHRGAAGEEERVRKARSGDPHLRSANEVAGYYISATDGDIGHVESFVVDDEGWIIRYLQIDTRNWLPGRKVVIAPDWLQRIDWSERKVTVDLTTDQIRNSPEYDPGAGIDRSYEARLYGSFQARPYWV